MDAFTIVSTAIGIIATVLGGVWFILQYAFKFGELSNRFSSMEKMLKDRPCDEHGKMLSKHAARAEATDKTLASIEVQLAAMPCRDHQERISSTAGKTEAIDKTLASISKTLADIEAQLAVMPCHDHQEKISGTAGKTEFMGKTLVGIKSQLLALPCKERSEELKEHTRRMDRNSSIVTELSKWVMKIDETMIDKLMQKCSPLKMTPAGEQLFAMSGADKTLEALAPRLMEQMSETELRTEYDVEGKALEVLLQNTDDPAFDSVKNFVYASPDTFTPEGGGESIKFSFYSIVHLMGIRLRDMYLERHPVAPSSAAAN